jgi:hypothetical protein
MCLADSVVAAHEFTVPSLQASAQQPQLATAADGSLYLVYGVDQTVYFAASQDGGKHFSRPVALRSEAMLSLGRHRGPRVAATGNAVVVTAIAGKQGRGRDGDLLAWRSADRGKTWSESVTLNRVAGSAREGLHAMTAGPSGLVFAAWLDLRNVAGSSAGTLLYGAASKDGGKTWEPDRLVYQSPDGTICQCCHPSVAIDAKGTIHVMWRNALGGSRDMYYLSSRDGGKTFTSAEKFGNGTWTLNACPMDGGDIAPTLQGEVASVWRRQDEIYWSLPRGEEQLVAKGKDPVIAYGAKGRYLAWEDNKARSVVVLAPDQQTPFPLGHESHYVDLVASPDGHIAAAWEESQGERKVIKIQFLD